MLLIPTELILECRSFTFLMSGTIFGFIMFPTMISLWLGRNAANANFVHNMNLVIGIFSGLLLTEWLRSGIKLRKRSKLCSFCHEVISKSLDEALASAGGKTKKKQQETEKKSASTTADKSHA